MYSKKYLRIMTFNRIQTILVGQNVKPQNAFSSRDAIYNNNNNNSGWKLSLLITLASALFVYMSEVLHSIQFKKDCLSQHTFFYRFLFF